MAVVYFTSNASTGAGSLIEAIQNAQSGDVVRPDETVFERGATIEIALASQLNVNKDLTLNASPFRISLNGGGAVACASVANGCVATFTAFEFIDGATSGNGGGVYAAPGANVKLDRCGVFGCDASGNGGGVCVDDGASLELNDGVIAGCRANVGGGVYLGATARFTSQGSTLAGNVDAASNSGSGGSSDVVAASGFDATSQTPINSIICAASSDNKTLYDATTAAGNGTVVGVPASELGFVAPPDPAASFESWSRNAWSNLNLRLLDDASPSPSIYRDSGAVAKMSRYDLDCNFRGRETNGVASCSPGAYETLQADLFWIGVEIDPTAPSDLTASDYDASARTLTLSWTPNLDGVTGYDVQTSTDGGITWSNLADMSADATSRLCGGLSAGRTYGYRIRAYNAAGTTAWSTIIFTPSALDEATVEIGTRAVVSPSMFMPNGWATSRFAQRPGDDAPTAGATLFIGAAATFSGATPLGVAITLGVGGVEVPAAADAFLTVGATFSAVVGGALSGLKLGDWGALTPSSLTIPAVEFIGVNASIAGVDVSVLDGVIFAASTQPATLTTTGSGGWADVTANVTALSVTPVDDRTVTVVITKSAADKTAFAQVSDDDGATWRAIATTAAGAEYSVDVASGADVAVRVATATGWITETVSTAPFLPVWTVTNAFESVAGVVHAFEVATGGSNDGLNVYDFNDYGYL